MGVKSSMTPEGLEGPVLIRTLLITLFALIAEQPAPARASDISAIRMITTATTESAPLNLVGRSFIRLEPAFNENIEAQRLTYIVRRASNDSNLMVPGLRGLLSNVSSGAGTISINSADSDSQVRAQLDGFLAAIDQSLAGATASRPTTADAIDRLKLALNSAITRQDMKLFSASVAEERLTTHYLILLDEETSDLLLLSLSQPAN